MPPNDPQVGETWVQGAMAWIVEERGHILRVPEPHLAGDHVLIRRARDNGQARVRDVKQFLRDYEYVSGADDE